MAAALGQDALARLPPHIRATVTKARTAWLKNSEVYDILVNCKRYRLPVATKAPNCPSGGCLFLFDRKAVRFFRKDGIVWRKTADGKTVRETHEQLKIHNKLALNCYYAHAEAKEALQRRCYWLLNSASDIVLVHYLSSNTGARPPSALIGNAEVAQTVNVLINAQELCQESAVSRAHTEEDSLASCSSAPLFGSLEHFQPAVTITTGRPYVHEPEKCHQGNTACQLASEPGAHSQVAADRSTELSTHCPDPNLTTPQSSTCQPQSEEGLCPDSLELPYEAGLGLPVALSYSGVVVETGARSDPLLSQRLSARQDSRHSSQTDANEGWLAPQTLPPRNSEATASSQQRHCREGRRQPAAGSSSAEQQGAACELKPAASLTRVDSDTLRVAPSLSRATCGDERTMLAKHAEPSEDASGRPSLPSSVSSPFYAAAFAGPPIRMSVPGLPSEVKGRARVQPLHGLPGLFSLEEGLPEWQAAEELFPGLCVLQQGSHEAEAQLVPNSGLADSRKRAASSSSSLGLSEEAHPRVFTRAPRAFGDPAGQQALMQLPLEAQLFSSKIQLREGALPRPSGHVPDPQMCLSDPVTLFGNLTWMQ